MFIINVSVIKDNIYRFHFLKSQKSLMCSTHVRILQVIFPLFVGKFEYYSTDTEHQENLKPKQCFQKCTRCMQIPYLQEVTY